MSKSKNNKRMSIYIHNELHEKVIKFFNKLYLTPERHNDVLNYLKARGFKDYDKKNNN